MSATGVVSQSEANQHAILYKYKQAYLPQVMGLICLLTP